MRIAVVTAALVLLALPLQGNGQSVSLSLDRFVPDVTRTNRTTIQVGFTPRANPPTRVDVVLSLSDGTRTNLTGLDPAAGARTATIPLPATPTDGTSLTLTGLIRRVDDGTYSLSPRPLTLVHDNTGPTGITVTSPTFPATAYSNPFLIRGTVRKTTGPEPGGLVTVRRRDPSGYDLPVGAGAILQDGTFLATVNLTGFPREVPIPVVLRAQDELGNPGAELVVTLTNSDPKPGVKLENLELNPVAGSLSNQPVVTISGSVSGERPPFMVTFLVDGFIESQITGLASGDRFRHSISLAADGTRRFTVRGQDGAGATVSSDLGQLTLDRVAPAPPTLLTPVPIVTNQPTITIRGIASERPVPGAARQPAILVLGPPLASIVPAQPQPVTDPTGQFSTTLDLSRLPDGPYSFRFLQIDAAGNVSSATDALLRAAGASRGAAWRRGTVLPAGLDRDQRRFLLFPPDSDR